MIICRIGANSFDEEEVPPQLDLLLFELDNVIDQNLKSIPDELISECQLALIYWSIDGREDTDYPPSTPEQHQNAARLIEKIGQIHLILAENKVNREGFIRDLFILEEQWIVSAIEYYSFIPSNDSNETLIYVEWIVYQNDFVSMYDLERSSDEDLGFVYILRRKRDSYSVELLIYFEDYCPSYMELKTFIIGDITGQMSLDAIYSLEYLS